MRCTAKELHPFDFGLLTRICARVSGMNVVKHMGSPVVTEFVTETEPRRTLCNSKVSLERPSVSRTIV